MKDEFKAYHKALYDLILTGLEDNDGHCLDNSWERKVVAAHLVQVIANIPYEPDFDEEEADEASEYE